jgi:hypothetical protein
MKKFRSCKIIVKSEADKREFIRACKHLHDFGVMFDKNKKITQVFDEWGEGFVSVNEKGRITRVKTEGKYRKLSKDECGVSLNFEEYQFVNFLAHLFDCDNKKDRDKFIIVDKDS